MKAIQVLKDYRNSGFITPNSVFQNRIDEAIKELEELENRSCESCNIGVKNHDGTITCMIKAYPEDKYSGDILKGKYYYRVNNSFCCNSWEKKI